MSCDPVPVVPAGAAPLGCLGAVNAAIAALPTGHARVASATFHYDCPPGADCAVWLFGVVDLRFADPGLPAARVRIALNADGHVQATLGQ